MDLSRTALDATHDPALRSWVASANRPDTDFPIQNLPFGSFRLPAEDAHAPWRIGVAIGDEVLDLQAAGLIAHADMNRLMALPAPQRRRLRATLSEGLRAGSPLQSRLASALHPQASVSLGLPCQIGDYTDFYASIHHATTVGRQFRPDQPLLPNYPWLPIGYHGRASSVVVSGHPVRRPVGQQAPAGADTPRFGPSRRLDYELELALFIGPGNALGEPIAIEVAEEHLFGVALLNDWSARDIQGWEYQPLGPFLAKNFASSVSPWIVTTEALAPFRAPFERPANHPQPLPYLDSAANRAQGALAITLEVWLQTAAMREAGRDGVRLSQVDMRDAAYWTPAQLITHHTVGGCNLQPGDLLGSGTLSGPLPAQAGSLLELSCGGKQPLTLHEGPSTGGEQRSFLEDGDTVIFKGWCERAGWRRIGLGECRGMLLPARDLT